MPRLLSHSSTVERKPGIRNLSAYASTNRGPVNYREVRSGKNTSPERDGTEFRNGLETPPLEASVGFLPRRYLCW